MARNTTGGNGVKSQDDVFGIRAFSQIDWKTVPLWKLVLVGTLGLVAFFIALSLVADAYKHFYTSHTFAPSDAPHSYYSYPEEFAVRQAGKEIYPTMGVAESRGDMISPPILPTDHYVSGDDAEAFETRSYRAYIETGALTHVCDAVEAMKPSNRVVFEYAFRGDTHCSYHFKVLNSAVPDVLAYISALNPKELTQTTESAKRQLDDFMDRRTILEQNAAALEEVLSDAIASYDALATLATREGNADALARSIHKKIELIDQLRQRREMIRRELDALSRAEAELQDRMAYTVFAVDVRELTYVNLDQLGDSWNEALQKFVADINALIQKLTLGLFTFLLYLVMFALYGFILLLIIKYGHRFVRDIWRA